MTTVLININISKHDNTTTTHISQTNIFVKSISLYITQIV